MIFGLRRVHAFSLVELTLALGIAAVCLLAVFGLMPIGVQTNRNTTSQSAAANIMAAVIADLRATSKLYEDTKTYSPGEQVFYGGSCYVAAFTTMGNPPPNPRWWSTGYPCPRFGISFGTDRCVSCSQPPLYFDSAGRFTTSPDGNSRYQLSVTFPTTGWNSASPKLSGASLKVTWPANADPSAPSGSAEMFAVFDRN
jgi:type II secretory pathway pseudopilin PulG